MSRKFISYAQYGKIKNFFFLFFLAVWQAVVVEIEGTGQKKKV